MRNAWEDEGDQIHKFNLLLTLSMARLDHFVLARKAGEEGTQSQCDWGGEGNEVEAPSSLPSCSAGRAPFFSRFTGEDTPKTGQDLFSYLY